MSSLSIPKGIEGDYIETKEDNLFFDVKGLLHPKSRKICFIRYIPDPKGERLKDNVKYKKIYDLNDRYSYLRKFYPKYLFYSQELDLELQGVKNNDIKNIFTPRECFKELSKKENLTKIENLSKQLCELIINKGKIPRNSIGITGSTMIGLAQINSDIDLVVYGTETSLALQDKLKSIFEVSNKCRKYNNEDYKQHYKWRVGGSNISFQDFLKSETRKLHQGKFHGIDFFIRYLKSPEDWQGIFHDFRFKNYGRIKIKATIVNSSDSIFTPCSYGITPMKILESDLKFDDFFVNDIKEIGSFRGRFCEHAKLGEKVLVEGKLEKIFYKNSFNHFRILLEDQIKDKMIILS